VAITDELGNKGTGLVIGVAAAVLTPLVLPLITSLARPLAKAAIKGGLITYEKGREYVAELAEVMEDLVAEAKAELESKQLQEAANLAASAVETATTAKPTTVPE
jgi:hypothetical protein